MRSASLGLLVVGVILTGGGHDVVGDPVSMYTESSNTPPAVGEAQQLFEDRGWIVDGAADSGPDPRSIRVFVDGAARGKFSELRIFHRFRQRGSPQVASVKGVGAIRLVLPPPGEFGGTFYLTGYWDCQRGFLQNLRIRELQIGLDPRRPRRLRLRGEADNGSTLEALDLTLTVDPPKKGKVRVRASYRLIAKRRVCVDQTRQERHEGFRVARIASSYVSSATHDSDTAAYRDDRGSTACVALENETGFIFDSPRPMGRASLHLGHSDERPRSTPTLTIRMIRPRRRSITPQGWVTATADANDDNIDLWANHDDASGQYTAGQVVGRFEFDLTALSPAPICVPTGPSPRRLAAARARTGGPGFAQRGGAARSAAKEES